MGIVPYKGDPRELPRPLCQVKTDGAMNQEVGPHPTSLQVPRSRTCSLQNEEKCLLERQAQIDEASSPLGNATLWVL